MYTTTRLGVTSLAPTRPGVEPKGRLVVRDRVDSGYTEDRRFEVPDGTPTIHEKVGPVY